MTWHELFTALEHADPASEVVVLYRPAGGTRGVRPGGPICTALAEIDPNAESQADVVKIGGVPR